MPDQFGRLTPGEFEELSAGYNWRQYENRKLLAWHAANLMNVWTKRNVTVNKLMGKGLPKPRFQRKADFKELWRRHLERHGRESG